MKFDSFKFHSIESPMAFYEIKKKVSIRSTHEGILIHAPVQYSIVIPLERFLKKP